MAQRLWIPRETGEIVAIDSSEAAEMLLNAKEVMIIPGLWDGSCPSTTYRT